MCFFYFFFCIFRVSFNSFYCIIFNFSSFFFFNRGTTCSGCNLRFASFHFHYKKARHCHMNIHSKRWNREKWNENFISFIYLLTVWFLSLCVCVVIYVLIYRFIGFGGFDDDDDAGRWHEQNWKQKKDGTEFYKTWLTTKKSLATMILCKIHQQLYCSRRFICI